MWDLLHPYFYDRDMIVSTISIQGVMTLAKGTFWWGQIREIAEGYGIWGDQECSD